jgi:single-stranded-DNA-specific exonuclease
MLQFGGHDAAAGMTLKMEVLEDFSIQFHKAIEKISSHLSPPTSMIDAVLPLEAIDLALMKTLHLLEPFGAGNPEPVFLTPSVGMSSPRTVGRKYLKTVVSQDNTHLEAIAFQPQIFDRFAEKSKYHVVHLPQLHSWNGIESIQLKLKALL